MRLSSSTPALAKKSAPLGPEILSSTGAWVGRKAPKAFPDSSSVLDNFQSAISTLLEPYRLKNTTSRDPYPPWSHDFKPPPSMLSCPEVEEKQAQDRKTIFETLSLPVAKILSPVARQAPTKERGDLCQRMQSLVKLLSKPSSEKKKAYTTTTERESFGDLFWLQRKTFLGD